MSPGPAGWSRYLALSIVVLGPLAFASLLLAALCQGTLWDCVPIWHDEVWYFNEIAVFEAAGWHGGYTVSHEWPAKIAASHFGPHGPFFPALYGTIARYAGLRPWTIPLLNAGFLVACSMLWVVCIRPKRREAWAAAVIAMTFWPLILYIPTSMQEVLHISVAFLLAALVGMLLRTPENRVLLLLALVSVVAAAFLRVTWSLVAVPVLWIAMRPRTLGQWSMLAAISGLLIGPLFVVAMAFNSPYPNFMSDVTSRLHDSPLGAVSLIVVHTLKGIVKYLGPTKDTFVQIGMRYQVLMIAGAAIYHLRRKPAGGASASLSPPAVGASSWGRLRASLLRFDDAAGPRSADGVASALHHAAFGVVLLNLVLVVGLVVVLYDVFDWRDYRVVAPHLLLSLLVLAGCGAREWLTGYGVVAVLLGALAVPQFAKFHRPRAAYPQEQIEAFAAQVADAAPFVPGASAWDNTLLIDIDPLKSPLLAGLPGGIGVSVVNFWDQQVWPPRSKYVLLDGALAARLGIPAGMQRVCDTELGTIYAQNR